MNKGFALQQSIGADVATVALIERGELWTGMKPFEELTTQLNLVVGVFSVGMATVFIMCCIFSVFFDNLTF